MAKQPCVNEAGQSIANNRGQATHFTGVDFVWLNLVDSFS